MSRSAHKKHKKDKSVSLLKKINIYILVFLTIDLFLLGLIFLNNRNYQKKLEEQKAQNIIKVKNAKSYNFTASYLAFSKQENISKQPNQKKQVINVAYIEPNKYANEKIFIKYNKNDALSYELVNTLTKTKIIDYENVLDNEHNQLLIYIPANLTKTQRKILIDQFSELGFTIFYSMSSENDKINDLKAITLKSALISSNLSVLQKVSSECQQCMNLVLEYANLLGQENFIESDRALISTDIIDHQNIQSKTIMFTGDLMLGRQVERLMTNKSDNYPFDKIIDPLRSATITFANLEGPIPDNHKQTANDSTLFSFKSNTANVLKNNYIDYVSLGNNHSLDYGEEGFEQTVQKLNANNIKYIGHSSDISQRHTRTINNGKNNINFFGYHATTADFDKEAAVKQLKGFSSNDINIVNIHWGNEYHTKANSFQESLAKTLIDAGADLIIGHHPHVVQQVEIYKDKLIFYSLGNFIFDQYFSKDTQEGLVVTAIIEGSLLKEVFVLPIKSKLSQPQLMNKTEEKIFLDRLAKTSSKEIAEQVKNGQITISSF